MSLEQEDELIGCETDEVPTIEADEKCRARRTQRDDEGVYRFQGYCRARAGKGTDHLGSGRCKWHGGCSPGAPSGHQRAATHCLDADPWNYYQSLDPEEREYIDDLARTIESRIQKEGEDPDHLDQTIGRRIAIEFHIVSKASKWVEEEGLVQSVGTGDGSYDRPQALLEEIRRRDKAIFEMLADAGALDGNVTGTWVEILSGESGL